MSIAIKNNVNESVFRLLLSGVLIFALCAFLSPSDANADNASPCNMPDFDRAGDQGVFIWQQCSTGEWFFRVSAGGLPSGVGAEFNVIGTLSLSKPILDLETFSLEPNDKVNSDLDSDPQNLKINFRAFTDSQDGFDFKLEEGTTACLNLTSPKDAVIVIGGENTIVNNPVNIETLDNFDCFNGESIPPVLFLLDD